MNGLLSPFAESPGGSRDAPVEGLEDSGSRQLCERHLADHYMISVADHVDDGVTNLADLTFSRTGTKSDPMNFGPFCPPERDRWPSREGPRPPVT